MIESYTKTVDWRVHLSGMGSREKYTLKALSPLGAELHGIQLSDQTKPSVIRSIVKDVHKHKVVIVKNQGVLSAEDQLWISRWFGEVEPAGFEQHPKCPHRDVLRVSNDEEEGYKLFGVAGFHIDGSFLEKPNAFSIYHIIHVPTKGNTLFVSLHDVYKSLPKYQRQRWDRLWLMKTFNRIRGYQDDPGTIIHPLVYKHPVTGKTTLCIHLGKTYRFIFDKDTPDHRMTSREETKVILEEIRSAIYRENEQFIYKHQWEPGDLILSDNLAVGHLASPDTQLPREEVGLRVMHRTVIRGTFRPAKKLPYQRNISPNCSLS